MFEGTVTEQFVVQHSSIWRPWGGWWHSDLVPSPLCSERSVTQGISRRRIWNATGQSLNFAMKKCGEWESIDKTYTCCFEERIFIVMSYLKTEFTSAYYDLRKASQSEQAPNCCSMCPWFMESGWVRHRGACSCFPACFLLSKCHHQFSCLSYPKLCGTFQTPHLQFLLWMRSLVCFLFWMVPWSITRQSRIIYVTVEENSNSCTWFLMKFCTTKRIWSFV